MRDQGFLNRSFTILAKLQRLAAPVQKVYPLLLVGQTKNATK